MTYSFPNFEAVNFSRLVVEDPHPRKCSIEEGEKHREAVMSWPCRELHPKPGMVLARGISRALYPKAISIKENVKKIILKILKHFKRDYQTGRSFLDSEKTVHGWKRPG